MNGFLVEVKVDVPVERGCVKMWTRMGGCNAEIRV